jgi:hypothetical protein
MEPGDQFRGRSINLLATDVERSINWNDQFPLITRLRGAFGYDAFVDGRVMGVPNLTNYGHHTSPTMLALLAVAFYDPKDQIGRAMQSPRAYRPNLARLLGVSMVVSDSEIENEDLVLTQAVGAIEYFVYRIRGVNLGQYSPVSIKLANNAAEVIDELLKDDFDGQLVAVSESEIDVELTQAESVEISILNGPVIRVDAVSAGTSLLVLPFDWSHCLKASGIGLIDVLPVNLSQTGLLISGNATVNIEYKFGLWSGTSCRRLDMERLDRLSLDDAAAGRVFGAAQ